MLENKFKTNLIKKIEALLPGCMVLHLDATEIQGIPDLLILYEDRWASIEVKKSANATHRPNQDYYVDLMDRMSFAAFVYPENEKEILYELEQSLKSRRAARVPRRKSVSLD